MHSETIDEGHDAQYAHLLANGSDNDLVEHYMDQSGRDICTLYQSLRPYCQYLEEIQFSYGTLLVPCLPYVT